MLVPKIAMLVLSKFGVGDMLTDIAIRSAKSQPKLKKLSDGGGLQLWVQPTGGKLWRLAYRYGGKQKLLAIGSYPLISLADARTARDDAKRLLAAGKDPSIAKKERLLAQSIEGVTFRQIAEEYVAKLVREGRAQTTITKLEWLLGFAYPTLGNQPIEDIKPAGVLEVLRQIEKRGRFETARRLRSTIGSVFRYAIATARADNDPTFALRGALTVPRAQPRAAITTERELGGLLRAIDTYDGQLATRSALKLMALLFPRPGELRRAEWPEIDLTNRVWTIPAERTKMRRTHKVPLSTQSIDILTELRDASGKGDLVFPSIRSSMRPISDNTLNGALRRLGYGQTEMTAHGFRATASTLLNESGRWHPDAIERALGHVEANEIRRAYARGQYWTERIEMATWWADHLDRLRETGAVVALSGTAA